MSFGMEMLDPQCFGHKPVLEIDDVSILVVGKLRLQTVTWFARLSRSTLSGKISW